MITLSQVQFPSKELLISYLENFPIAEEESTKKKIIVAVATVFANQDMLAAHFHHNIGVALRPIKDELGLSDSETITIHKIVIQALKNCENHVGLRLGKRKGVFF